MHALPQLIGCTIRDVFDLLTGSRVPGLVCPLSGEARFPLNGEVDLQFGQGLFARHVVCTGLGEDSVNYCSVTLKDQDSA
jgi:hypothetical protein